MLNSLKSQSLRLREETTQMLQGFRKKSETFRGELQAARKVWQKTAAVLAKERQHSKRGAA